MYLKIFELLLRLAVLIMAGFVVPAFRSWLKKKSENEDMEKIRGWVYAAVYAAEQIYNHAEKLDPEGKIRKTYARNMVTKILLNHGITITERELDVLIEAAVNTLNSIHAAESPIEGGPEDDSSKEDS